MRYRKGLDLVLKGLTFTVQGGQKVGTEAGAELKTKAPAEFFAMLIENGGNW